MSNVSRLILKYTARLGNTEINIPTYFDIVHPKNKPEKTAKEVKQEILDEYRRIGGAKTSERI